MVYTYTTKAAFLAEPPAAREGDMALLAGSVTPGQFPLQYTFRAGSAAPADGGLVLAAENGRWVLAHSGEVSFAAFGVVGPETPADDALDALVADESVKVIHAYTPLNFTRRHRFSRSGIQLDFHDNLVTAVGVEPAPANDPFSGILYFGGTAGPLATTVQLSAPLKVASSIFEVDDAQNFPEGSWWRVRCDTAGPGGEEREIDKLLMVTVNGNKPGLETHLDETHVRFNYNMGWELAAGRTLEYYPVRPVCDVTVRNMRFVGNGGGEANGAQPVAFEYAVRCNAENLHAEATYWPVVMRRHNTWYETTACSLTDPVEVLVGGTGYLTQQIHCLYGAVRDCRSSNARHLNDFTGSAYCRVENCHGDGNDTHGSFVTHGQFEHDLSYTGNSGLLSFANSGATWGSSAARIRVSRHIGSLVIGNPKVSDLTLEDVTCHATEAYDGTIRLNADGVQVRGCRAEQLWLRQLSSRSERPCVIDGCYFRQGVLYSALPGQEVTNTVIFRDNKEGEPEQ